LTKKEERKMRQRGKEPEKVPEDKPMKDPLANRNETPDFAEDMRIDLDALDREWWRQPQLYARYARLSAGATARAKRAEDRVKQVRSELILRFLSEASSKPTDKILEAMYRTHPEHLAAKEEWLEATEEADAYQQALWALGHRKDALENATRLFLAQYFAGSSPLPHDLSFMRERVTEDRGEAFREKLADRQARRRT
jgi:hypothetical protein